MTNHTRRRTAGSVPGYVLQPYWQCMKCLCVTRDPKWTKPDQRKCQHCNKPANEAYIWPPCAATVYHAVLYRFKENDDWVAITMQSIVLCSLAELHESRLISSILERQGCPTGVVHSIEKSVRRPDYLRLFKELVGKKAKDFIQCSEYKLFWSELEMLRKFRNDFVHCEPEKLGRGPEQIPKDLGGVVESASRSIELAFQEITNKVLAHISSKL